ncbi:MAG: M15 family metallopeptidase [Chloroflexi bacterium]|nr:M15 family metallopeptidase [Chloroflexota bacterium]
MRSPVRMVGAVLLMAATVTLTGCAFSGGPPSASVIPSPSISPSVPVPSSIGITPTPVSSPHVVALLPDCRYDDVAVTVDPAEDWATVVVDTIYRLPRRYAPDDLVGTSRAGLNSGFQVSRLVIDDLRDMAAAAVADDAGLAIQSAFRSYQYQVTTYAGWVARSSETEARKVSARPGHSEHQLGTAIDFRSADDATPPWELDDFADTVAGGWLHDHAWEYGFVLSYPKGASDETCYSYEPWHYRYVGKDVAAAIHASGETPRRYLWDTYEPSEP